jgi:hypothetical protein
MNAGLAIPLLTRNFNTVLQFCVVFSQRAGEREHYRDVD